MTTVSGEDIKVVGSASVEEYLNTLPQLVAGATKSTNVTGQADATANLNLRGLGAKRTLVLVNGKRFMASNQQGIVDVNNIPASLVERVEVVTGGASAVYGSDAMAGVVNFILKDKFDGLQVEGQYGISGQGDAQDWSTSLTFGASGERASVMMYVNYEDRAALRGNERELSRYSTIDSNGVFVRSGTAGRVGGTLIGIPTPNGTGGFTNRDYALDNLIPRPFIAATDTNYELQQDYAIQTPLQRTNVYGRGTYDFTDTIQGYLDFGYNNVKSSAILARTAPNIRETTNVPGLPYNASFVSPQMAALLAARSNPTAPFALRFEAPSQFPKREIAFARDLYRVLGGFEGTLGDWKWDASYSYSHRHHRSSEGRHLAPDVRRGLDPQRHRPDQVRQRQPALRAGDEPHRLVAGPGQLPARRQPVDHRADREDPAGQHLRLAVLAAGRRSRHGLRRRAPLGRQLGQPRAGAAGLRLGGLRRTQRHGRRVRRHRVLR